MLGGSYLNQLGSGPPRVVAVRAGHVLGKRLMSALYRPPTSADLGYLTLLLKFRFDRDHR